MSKVSLRDRLEDYVQGVQSAKSRYEGDAFTQRLYDDMTSSLAKQIPEMDFGDDRQTYRGTTLLYLGQVPNGQATVGGTVCQRAAYLGADGKAYIEGPRKKLGMTVIDIHPYSVEDAMGVWRGVYKSSLVDLLTTYFI